MCVCKCVDSSSTNIRAHIFSVDAITTALPSAHSHITPHAEPASPTSERGRDSDRLLVVHDSVLSVRSPDRTIGYYHLADALQAPLSSIVEPVTLDLNLRQVLASILQLLSHVYFLVLLSTCQFFFSP